MQEWLPELSLVGLAAHLISTISETTGQVIPISCWDLAGQMYVLVQSGHAGHGHMNVKHSLRGARALPVGMKHMRSCRNQRRMDGIPRTSAILAWRLIRK